MTSLRNQVTQAIEYLQPRLGNDTRTAVLLGTGLNDLFNSVSPTAQSSVLYGDIPGMTQPAVESHQGQLQRFQIGQKSILACQGRLHLYEGYSAHQVALLIYILRELGIDRLIITNAAGALNPSYRPGDVMIINDHINHTGHNPIRGQGDELGQRFADMSRAYEPKLAAQALRIGSNLSLPVHSGVYVGVLGPSLETSAERRMLRTWGADAVGMSTVIETIAANHCGMQVLGLSAISNMATGDTDQQVDTIESVLDNAACAAESIKQILLPLLELQ